MGTQAAQNWLLLANLVAIGVYVWLTRGIKRASLEQSEGLSKPAVTASFERNELGAPGRGPSKLSLINVGNGPALALSWMLWDDQVQPQRIRDGELAYIAAGAVKEVPFDYPGGPAGHAECTFQGASGITYRSRTELSGNGTPLKFRQEKSRRDRG